MNILDFVMLGKRVTDLYAKVKSTWNPFEAVAHQHAEVSEVWDVLRNKKDENGVPKYGETYSAEWYDHLAEEVADSMISGLTTWEVVPGTTSRQLAEKLESKMNTVYDRAIEFSVKENSKIES